MVVLAQLVGEVDDAAFLKLHLLDAFGPMPAQRRDVSPARALRHLQAHVLFLHVARSRGDSNVLREKDRLWIAHAHRLKPPEPGEDRRCYPVDRQHSIAFKRRTQVFVAELLGSVTAQPRAELFDAIRRQGEADRMSVSSEAREEVAAGLDGLEQVKPAD